MKLSHYLGDKAFWRVASGLALPIALQNVLTSSFQLVDTMMVSNLGDLTLSATGMAGQWGWLATLLGFGLASGMSIFVSQYWGVKDHKGIRRVLGMGLITSLLLSLVFMAVALLFPEQVLSLFNKDPDVIAVGSRYLSIVCLSYPAVALSNVLSNVLRGTERVRLPLYVSIFTTIANVLVNYALIFGKFGMPRLGASGAAIATCVSSWLGPILIMLFSLKQKNLLIGPVRELLDFNFSHLRQFIQRAIPVMLNEGMWALGILVLNMIYSNQGYEYYAGMTIFKTFADLTFAFYAGLGGACVVMVGKSVGRGKIERCLEDATRFNVLVPLAGVIIGGLTILVRHPLISLFASGDNLSAVTLETALAVTVFCSIEVGFRNISYVQIVGVFRSGGDALFGMLYDLGSIWLVSIPLALLAANVLHLPFLAIVMVAYLGEDIPKSLLCLWHFKTGRWLKPVTPEGQAALEQFRSKTNK